MVDLPMDNSSVLMQIFECFGDLHDDMSTQILAKVRQSDNLVEELSTRAKLKDDEIVLAGLGEADKLDNIGVI